MWDWDDPEGTICPWCQRSGYLLVPSHDHNATRCFGPCCRCPQGCPVPGGPTDVVVRDEWDNE